MDVTIPCPCPEKDDEPRHAEDTVTLRDKLDFRTAVTMQEAVTMIGDVSPEEKLAALDEAYLLYGIASWSLVDAKGKPVPVSRDAVTTYLLSDAAAAMAVFAEAERIYNPVVLLPLVKRGLSSSGSTPTTEPTSAGTSSQAKPQKLPKRSSTTTTPTDGIEVTSPSLVGVSRSSPSSVSAA